MAMYIQPSIRCVLCGSMLLLVSTACRRSERSDVVESRTPSQGTPSSQAAPVSPPTESPSALREEQSERIHVTGKDVESSLQDQRQEEEHFERIHVTGKDDEQQVGGGGRGGASGAR